MNEKISRVALFWVTLLTLLCFLPLRQLKFGFDIEKFFPAGDPDRVFFRSFQEQFHSETDDEFIFLGLTNRAGIFRQDFLVKADSLARYLSRQEHIIKVYSLTSFSLLYFQNNEINARPLLHIDRPDLYASDSVNLFGAHEYRDLLVSKDGRSIAIAAFNAQGLTNAQKDALLGGIRQKINDLGFDETHITAKIRVERIYAKEIEKNLRKYLLISLTLICMVLYILFHSVKAILVPLLIIVISVTWTMALIALTGHKLDILSSLIPPILAAICMSDIIHITTHYIEQLRAGLPKQEALNKAYREIGLATFYTCCTVAAGFITLGITDIIPIRNFGLFTAAGLFIAFGITLVVLYAYYSFTPPPRVAGEQQADRRWNRFLAGLLRGVLKNKLAVFAGLGLLSAVSLYYTTKIEINSSLLMEIPRKNPMLDDYRFMEKDFSGTRSFEMELTLKDSQSSFFDPALMREVEKAETFLKDSCGVGYLISPLSLFRGANKAFRGGENSFYQLPDSLPQVARYFEAISQTEYAAVMEHYLSPDGKRLRISGRLPNLSIKEFKPVKNKINRYFRDTRNSFSFSHRLTGSAILIDKITYSLTRNLFTGIYLDALVICLIAFLLLRNGIIMLIVLIPNVIPLVFMSGIMGLLGIHLKEDTSVIFAIALGLAVDDTIHFLSRIRLELANGRPLAYAVKRTYLSTGKAIVITTLVLLSGFMTLLSSSFGGTFYIGLLISLCLFVAMILELTITPLLLLLFYKKKGAAGLYPGKIK